MWVFSYRKAEFVTDLRFCEQIFFLSVHILSYRLPRWIVMKFWWLQVLHSDVVSGLCGLACRSSDMRSWFALNGSNSSFKDLHSGYVIEIRLSPHATAFGLSA